MSKTMVLNNRSLYYVKLTASEMAENKQLIEQKRIEQVVKHRNLGYVVKVYESDIDQIRKDGIVKLSVWPDGDSYTYIDEFKVDSIYKETVTLEQI
jgi:hypothetical protein